MKSLLNKAKAGGVAKSFLTLVTGTVCAQLFSLLFYPILGRLFLPEEFGILSNLSAIVSVVVVIASGKYEQAVIITRDKEETVNVLALSILLSLVICMALSIVCLLFANPILEYYALNNLKGWINFMPLIAFFIIIYNCFNEWCVKKGAFSSLAVNKITNSASMSLSKFVFGVFHLMSGLIVGEIVGRGISAISCVYHWIKNDKNDLDLVSLKSVKNVFVKYKKFPIYVMPDQLINVLTGNLSIFFIATYFGEKNLGYYSMSQNVLAIPMTFIGQALMDVFRNQASSDFQEYGNCMNIYKQLSKKIIPLMIVALILAVFIIKNIFVIILGKNWEVSGEFSQILIIPVAITFLHLVFSSVWVIAGKQRERFLWQILFFASVLISLFLGCRIFDNVNKAIICLSVAMTLVHAVGLYATWYYSKGKINE